MISKEIVIAWFKGLSGDDRIELMCLLLDFCLPSELRFIGTYLEAAAQKDYFGFRTYESAANNPNDLSYLYPLEDVAIRRRMCLYVALLHSSNRQAAGVLFGILSVFQPSDILDDEALTELSLLYTLSANHPAFSFNQKHVLRSKLKCLRLQSVTTTSDLGETVSDCSTGSSTFLQDAEQTDSPCSISPTLHENANKVDLPEITKEEKSEEFPFNPENPPKVFVKDIKVLNIQKKGESKTRHESKKKEDYEYAIEVTWSDGTSAKIHKSYEEMFDFQCKLRKMYPTKIDENGQPWKLPFLPGRIRIFNKSEHKGERTPIPDISDYTRLFGSLPVFVRGCEHVLNFFHIGTKSRGRDKKPKSVKKDEKKNRQESSNKDGEKQTDMKINDDSSVDCDSNPAKHAATHDSSNCSNLLNINANKNGLLQVNSTQTSSVSHITAFGPPNKAATSDTNSMHSTSVYSHSQNLFLYPSIHNRPALFPASSVSHSSNTVESTIHSRGSSPISESCCTFDQHSSTDSLGWTYCHATTRSCTVQDWLKTLRLHKYSQTFKGKSFNELLQYSDKELEKLGMTTGARRKLRVNVEMLRKRGRFTSDGQRMVDVLPVLNKDFTLLSTSSKNGYLYKDNDWRRMLSESDSGSECGSDILLDIYSIGNESFPFTTPNGCRLSCYNCGSLGHVGGQCMAPNMEKRVNYGYRLRLDAGLQVLQ